MTAPAARDVGLVLLDIEGTTTPIAFVHDTLFSYARQHLTGWLEAHAGTGDAEATLEMLADERTAEAAREMTVPAWREAPAAARRESAAAFAFWLMARDRKSPALKQLQGLVWEAGYQAGELRGVVYDDVPRALRRWRRLGLEVAIYSSGSVLAQRRLFESVPEGDLTPLITRFFDTAVGAKTDAASYRAIAHALGRPTQTVLFVSDVTRELQAARAAGMQTRLSVRPGNPLTNDAREFLAIASLDDVLPEASPLAE